MSHKPRQIQQQRTKLQSKTKSGRGRERGGMMVVIWGRTSPRGLWNTGVGTMCWSWCQFTAEQLLINYTTASINPLLGDKLVIVINIIIICSQCAALSTLRLFWRGLHIEKIDLFNSLQDDWVRGFMHHLPPNFNYGYPGKSNVTQCFKERRKIIQNKSTSGIRIFSYK